MKSPNKIRERDMDDDFLLSLRTGMDPVEARKLLVEYLRKDEMVSAGQLPISDIRRLLGLDMEDLDTLLHTFVSVVLKLISAEQSKGFKVSVQRNGNTYVIKVIDDDSEEHDIIVYSDSLWETERIRSVFVNVNGKRTGVFIEDDDGVQQEVTVDTKINFNGVSEDVARMIIDLRTQVNNLQSKVNQLESGSGSGFYSNSSMLYEDIINKMNLKNAKLSNRMDTYELVIREIQRKLSVLEIGDIITKEKLSQDIIDKLDQVDEIQSTVNTLDNKYLQAGNMTEGQIIYCIDNNLVVGGRDLVVYATICFDDNELAQAKSEKRKLIINVSNGISYEYDSKNDEYDELPFVGNHKNDNVFICNVDTKNIQFVILDDKFIEFAGGGGMAGGSGVTDNTNTTDNTNGGDGKWL